MDKKNQPKKVFFLGAGFSKAINKSYPTLHELTNYTISSFTQHNKSGALREHFDNSPHCLKTNIESFLSYLCLKHPWKSSIEQDLDNALYKSLISEISLILGEIEKFDKNDQVKLIPDSIISKNIINLLKYINANQYTSITLNYDTLFERICSTYCKNKKHFFRANPSFFNGYSGIEVYLKNIADINNDNYKIDKFSISECIKKGSNLINLIIDEDFFDTLNENQFLNLFEKYCNPNYQLQQTFRTLKSSRLKPKTFVSPHELGTELLKLHGSLDWLYINENNNIRLLKEKEINTFTDFAQPFIIPPIADKNIFYNQSIIELQWIKAHQAISEATEIHIIGFSFPPTDTSVKFLFQSALKHNNAKIYVINLENDQNFKSRYCEIFKEDNLSFDFCGGVNPLEKFINEKILDSREITL